MGRKTPSLKIVKDAEPQSHSKWAGGPDLAEGFEVWVPHPSVFEGWGL
jgi:hypothetical protein